MKSQHVIALALLALTSTAHARSDYEDSKIVGTCAALQSARGVNKDTIIKTWAMAPDMGAARHAAWMWRTGIDQADDSMFDSYMVEGINACKKIGVELSK